VELFFQAVQKACLLCQGGNPEAGPTKEGGLKKKISDKTVAKKLQYPKGH